jgi:hypothetical protein
LFEFFIDLYDSLNRLMQTGGIARDVESFL